MTAKIKLRELGVKSLNWKDPVSVDDKTWWCHYFQEIEKLRMIGGLVKENVVKIGVRSALFSLCLKKGFSCVLYRISTLAF